ncbi:MAG: prefoldin subunit beta [Candidatus Aenigmarchaeota archaeon]|nr:prefoldin subunit beta [Candidatus Aenigmarchaeota archaeon]
MVTEEDKKFLGQFQAYQQQLQSIMIQKENLKLQMFEIEKALEELEASKEKEAYKITGSIMIKKNSIDLKNELKEKKDSFDVRTKTLEKAEERITTKLKDMEPKLREMIKE